MARQIAGHLLVDSLIAQGVEIAFGVPGESYLAVLDGFHAQRERIRFITCRQEGGAAFMAEAVGKLTGRPGVCLVNTAFQDSTPMVLLVGDVGSDFRDREAFQEVDFQSFFGPSTKGMAKRVERIDDARRIPEYVARAFATAMNGRPGPVVLGATKAVGLLGSEALRLGPVDEEDLAERAVPRRGDRAAAQR